MWCVLRGGSRSRQGGRGSPVAAGIDGAARGACPGGRSCSCRAGRGGGAPQLGTILRILRIPQLRSRLDRVQRVWESLCTAQDGAEGAEQRIPSTAYRPCSIRSLTIHRRETPRREYLACLKRTGLRLARSFVSSWSRLLRF